MTESLRLRETTTDAGLRATSGEGALRQDGFVPSEAVPADLYTKLDVRLFDYDKDSGEWSTKINWRIKSTPTTDTPASGLLNISEARIRYAWDGYPEFWTDGEYLDTYSPTSEMANPYHHSGIKTDQNISNWLYYSLFYKYTDSSDNVYTERAATGSVLIPTYHALADSMWERIPPYYRGLDTTASLQSFLSVFGWEADQHRSLMDEVMHLKDAYRVHYDSLDHLADSLGSVFDVQEVRPHQLREMLGDSKRYYSQRGRADTMLALLGLLSDSEVSYREFRTTGAAASAPYSRIKFTVTANRLNLIKDPRLNGAPGASTTWNHLTSTSSGSITVANTGAGTNGVSFSTNGSSAGTAYIFPGDAVQIKRAIPYYSSVAATLTNATAQVRLYREKPTSAGSLPDESQYYHTDDTTYANYYKTLTLNSEGGTYSTDRFIERSGFETTPSTAVAHAVYLTGSTNGVLFSARLYSDTSADLYSYDLKLTRVDANPSSGSRFDRFDLAVNDGSTDVLTANNLTVNTSGQVIDEDDSSVVTKLTNTSGGVAYTLLIDDVATISYASTTELPSDDTATYPFVETGVEDLYPVIVITLGNDATASLDKWIFQPFSNGPYFDGTILDGHSYKSGSSVISDYYWSGAANNSVSLYTTFRQKAHAAMRKALTNNIPLTVATELTSGNYHTSTAHGHLVSFDATPGDEQAFDPHSWNSDVYTEGTISSLSD